MKRNRPPRPPLESADDGNFTPAGSRKTLVDQTVWQGLATVGSLGFTLVGCTFLGLAVGYALDRWLGSGPWLTILLLLLGIGAGFLNIFTTAARLRNPPR